MSEAPAPLAEDEVLEKGGEHVGGGKTEAGADLARACNASEGEEECQEEPSTQEGSLENTLSSDEGAGPGEKAPLTPPRWKPPLAPGSAGPSSPDAATFGTGSPPAAAFGGGADGGGGGGKSGAPPVLEDVPAADHRHEDGEKEFSFGTTGPPALPTKVPENAPPSPDGSRKEPALETRRPVAGGASLAPPQPRGAGAGAAESAGAGGSASFSKKGPPLSGRGHSDDDDGDNEFTFGTSAPIQLPVFSKELALQPHQPSSPPKHQQQQQQQQPRPRSQESQISHFGGGFHSQHQHQQWQQQPQHGHHYQYGDHDHHHALRRAADGGAGQPEALASVMEYNTPPPPPPTGAGLAPMPPPTPPQAIMMIQPFVAAPGQPQMQAPMPHAANSVDAWQLQQQQAYMQQQQLEQQMQMQQQLEQQQQIQQFEQQKQWEQEYEYQQRQQEYGYDPEMQQQQEQQLGGDVEYGAGAYGTYFGGEGGRTAKPPEAEGAEKDEAFWDCVSSQRCKYFAVFGSIGAALVGAVMLAVFASAIDD